MAIGKTKLDELLKRGKLLKELSAWEGAFNQLTKDQLIQWVQDQLQQGKDGKNVLMGKYKKRTEELSGGKKITGTPYTFEDTGYFYKSMEVIITDFSFEIKGDGKKIKHSKANLLFSEFELSDEEIDLYEVYSQFLTTLNDEHIEKLKTIINKAYIDYIRKILRID